MIVLDDISARLKTITLRDFLEMFLLFFVKLFEKSQFVLIYLFTTISNKLFFSLLYGLEKCGRKRIIMDRTDEEPYLERYYIFLKERENFPFNIFIHKFLKSDPDDLHDHPWGFRTVILKGGYWEHTEKGRFWRKPGFTQSVTSKHKHRVELINDTPCWTLFMPFKREREWGFYKDDKWIESEEYFQLRIKEKNLKTFEDNISNLREQEGSLITEIDENVDLSSLSEVKKEQ